MEIFTRVGIALNLSGWWLLYFKIHILKNVKQNVFHVFFLDFKKHEKKEKEKK